MNPAEKYQDEIDKIFDDFCELMRYSRARIVVESQRYYGFCVVKFKLFKCRSCVQPLLKSTIYVRTKTDIIHLEVF